MKILKERILTEDEKLQRFKASRPVIARQFCSAKCVNGVWAIVLA